MHPFKLIYVDEPQGSLSKRKPGHRFQINNGGQQLSYKHFNFPDHSVLSVKVGILEKKNHHHTKSQSLRMPFRKQREELWIRKQGTA